MKVAAPPEAGAGGPDPPQGYGVDDVPYRRSFHQFTAPAWLDHAVLVNGIQPPRREDGFAWCDLGCGLGVTAALLAATHPTGIFHGVDMMPDHIGFARRLAEEAAIANVTFHAIDFTSDELDLPRFDYIVAHGVYSWVSPAARAALTALIARHLKPEGLVYVSYDAMPGRANVIPAQKLLMALGKTFPGDSIARMEAAAKVVRAMAELHVPVLNGSSLVADIDPQSAGYSANYLVHAFMTATWQPFFVTEIRSLMSEVGLVPAGTASLDESQDDYVLGRHARELLAEIADEDVRELARDFFLTQEFRRDVFARQIRRLSEEERRARLLASTYALTGPAAGVAYSMPTQAGTVRFDNATSRALVAAAAAGPTSFADLDERLPQDVLANVRVLCAAGILRPVEPGEADVGTINSVILRRFGKPDELGVLALSCGTALPINDDLLQLAQVAGAGVGGREIVAEFGAKLAPKA